MNPLEWLHRRWHRGLWVEFPEGAQVTIVGRMHVDDNAFTIMTTRKVSAEAALAYIEVEAFSFLADPVAMRNPVVVEEFMRLLTTIRERGPPRRSP